MKILICIPIGLKDKNRLWYSTSFPLVLESLIVGLNNLKKNDRNFHIQFMLNNYDSTTRRKQEFVEKNIKKLFFKYPHEILKLKISGKINVINHCIHNIDKVFKGLLVIDDDIVINKFIIGEFISFLKSNNSGYDVFSCRKSPIYGKNKNNFNKTLEFIFYPPVQNYLNNLNIEFNMRPTGSFYGIPANKLELFPNPCNEAEVFNSKNIKLSQTFVYTWYPDSFQAEVKRRQFHINSENHTEINNFESKTLIFLKYTTLISSNNVFNKVNKRWKDRIKNSFYLLNNIVEKSIKL